MAIKFKHEGIEFEASTAKEAAQLVRELRRMRAMTSLTAFMNPYEQAVEALHNVETRNLRNEAVHAVPVSQLAVEAATPDRLVLVRDFLRAIRDARDAGSRGLNADEIGKVLKINHPKGLGPRSTLINNVLGEVGFSADSVYRNDRTSQGRIWTSAEHLDRALAAVERAIGTQKELIPTN